jgi:hypothetical protein
MNSFKLRGWQPSYVVELTMSRRDYNIGRKIKQRRYHHAVGMELRP